MIGAAKSVKHLILSIPQGHPSPLVREEPPLVFLRLLHPDIQLDQPKVFLQFTILHPESGWINDILCVQVVLVFQVKEYGPVKHELCGLLLTFSGLFQILL